MIKSGETKKVEIDIKVEEGKVNLLIGSSSEDIKMTKQIKVTERSGIQ